MSTVGSIFSTRSSVLGYKLNERVASIMDSIFAIGFGLAVRYVVDQASHNELKVSGTLVGIWEGVVLLHFTQKMPHSYDPYIGLAVRLFIDFLVTESVPRLVLILLWTGMGMVLADIAPVLWEDTGMRRIWSRFRRDLILISRSIPPLPFFNKRRITMVRFSPSRGTSMVSASSSHSTPTPSVITASPPQPPTPRRRSRLVPGAFESETETGSIISALTRSDFAGSPSNYTYTATIPPSDFTGLDEDDLYASSGSSTTTERPEDADLPEIIVDSQEEVNKSPSTPKQVHINVLPPTPSDSMRDIDHNIVNPLVTVDEEVPSKEDIPNIPDTPDAVDDDWENIEKADVPPPLPPKDNDQTSVGKRSKAPSSSDDTVKPVIPKSSLLDLDAGPSSSPVPGSPKSAKHSIEDLVETEAFNVWNLGSDVRIEDPTEPDHQDEAQRGDETIEVQPLAQETEAVESNLVEPEVAAESSSAQLDPATSQQQQSQSPPPSFQELYPEHTEPLDADAQRQASSKGPSRVGTPVSDMKGKATIKRPFSPAPSLTESVPTGSGLAGALQLRKKIEALRKRHNNLLKKNAEGSAAEDLAKQIEDLEDKITTICYEDNTPVGEPSDKLDVTAGQDPDEAALTVEHRLRQLLSTESKATTLDVTFPKGAPKARPFREKVATLLTEHKLESQNSGRILSIQLPSRLRNDS